jgi:hypothetical protein
MEVHHHPEIEKKNFKQYLLEGLMIFLAVMMGYLAETVREHIADHHKGQEYIKSFVTDLRNDTAQYDKLITELTLKDSVLNHLYSGFDTILQKKHTSADMATIIKNAAGFTDFIYTDRTIQQLKNAGGLRMIDDQACADSIMAYDSMVRAEMIHQESLERWQQLILEAHATMIPFEQLSHIRALTEEKGARAGSISLLSGDTRDLNVYFNKLWLFKSSCLGQLKRLKRLKANAVRVIAFLQKEEN